MTNSNKKMLISVAQWKMQDTVFSLFILMTKVQDISVSSTPIMTLLQTPISANVFPVGSVYYGLWKYFSDKFSPWAVNASVNAVQLIDKMHIVAYSTQWF